MLNRYIFNSSKRILSCVLHNNSIYAKYFSNIPYSILKMPALSPTMTKGNIGEWHLKEGASFETGTTLVTIETDKASVDYDADEDGYLAKILLETGNEDITLGTPIAITTVDKSKIKDLKTLDWSKELRMNQKQQPQHTKSDENNGKNEEKKRENYDKKTLSKEKKNESKSKKDEKNVENKLNNRMKISPLAKTLSKENNIDYNNIKGSGPNNRIIKDDILHYNNNILENKGINREKWSSNKFKIPHYYLNVDINLSNALNFLDKINTSMKSYLSLKSLYVKAIAKYPDVKCYWNENSNKIYQYNSYNLNFSSKYYDNEILPLLSNVDEIGLDVIEKMINKISKKENEDDIIFEKGIITIIFTDSQFTHIPIIRPNQSASIAISNPQQLIFTKRKINNNNEDITQSDLLFGLKSNITMSCDHRIIDGALGANFLKEIM